MYKCGLALQGGGYRGTFTAGVLDVLIENDIYFDDVIGTSCGALNGINYLSKKSGRNITLMVDYRNDKNFVSIRNLLFKRNIFDTHYLFHDMNLKVPFDEKTFFESPSRFRSCVSEFESGEAVYFDKNEVDKETFYYATGASMSLPLLSTPREINGKHYLDGGNTDPMGFHPFLESGKKFVVILTRDINYRKGKQTFSEKWAAHRYRKYKEYSKSILDYSNLYNSDMEKLISLEKEGKVFIIAPSEPVKASRLEKNKEKLISLYEEGKKVANMNMQKLKAFLNDTK